MDKKLGRSVSNRGVDSFYNKDDDLAYGGNEFNFIMNEMDLSCSIDANITGREIVRNYDIEEGGVVLELDNDDKREHAQAMSVSIQEIEPSNGGDNGVEKSIDRAETWLKYFDFYDVKKAYILKDMSMNRNVKEEDYEESVKGLLGMKSCCLDKAQEKKFLPMWINIGCKDNAENNKSLIGEVVSCTLEKHDDCTCAEEKELISSQRNVHAKPINVFPSDHAEKIKFLAGEKGLYNLENYCGSVNAEEKESIAGQVRRHARGAYDADITLKDNETPSDRTGDVNENQEKNVLVQSLSKICAVERDHTNQNVIGRNAYPMNSYAIGNKHQKEVVSNPMHIFANYEDSTPVTTEEKESFEHSVHGFEMKKLGCIDYAEDIWNLNEESTNLMEHDGGDEAYNAEKADNVTLCVKDAGKSMANNGVEFRDIVRVSESNLNNSILCDCTGDEVNIRPNENIFKTCDVPKLKNKVNIGGKNADDKMIPMPAVEEGTTDGNEVTTAKHKIKRRSWDSRTKKGDLGTSDVGSERTVIERNVIKRTDACVGMIFMCNTLTKKDCYRYKILGLPSNKKAIVEKVFEGMTLFLFDVDSKLLHGIYIASESGGYNVEPKAFKSSFPSQVRFSIVEDCPPLPEKKFKPIIRDNYYQKNKFRFELSSEEVKNLFKIFRSGSRRLKIIQRQKNTEKKYQKSMETSKRRNGPQATGNVAIRNNKRKREVLKSDHVEQVTLSRPYIYTEQHEKLKRIADFIYMHAYEEQEYMSEKRMFDRYHSYISGEHVRSKNLTGDKYHTHGIVEHDRPRRPSRDVYSYKFKDYESPRNQTSNELSNLYAGRHDVHRNLDEEVLIPLPYGPGGLQIRDAQNHPSDRNTYFIKDHRCRDWNSEQLGCPSHDDDGLYRESVCRIADGFLDRPKYHPRELKKYYLYDQNASARNSASLSNGRGNLTSIDYTNRHPFSYSHDQAISGTPSITNTRMSSFQPMNLSLWDDLELRETSEYTRSVDKYDPDC